jgi:hypothetical protein
LATVDLAHQAAEDFAWSYFNEKRRVPQDEHAHGVDPADGSGDLADKGFAELIGLSDKSCVDIDGDG